MPAGQPDGRSSPPPTERDSPPSSDDDPSGSSSASPASPTVELLGLPPGLDGGLIGRCIPAAIAEIQRRSPDTCHARVANVAVRFVADDEMSRLHARHCGDPSTTDVLTFHHAAESHPAGQVGPADADGPADSVDLALCVDVARREAAERGHPVEHELILYAVHGLLHCVGHDDHDPDAFEAMHAEEDRILEAIGLGATFRDRGAGEPLR